MCVCVCVCVCVGQISKYFKTVETVDHFEAHYARSTLKKKT